MAGQGCLPTAGAAALFPSGLHTGAQGFFPNPAAPQRHPVFTQHEGEIADVSHGYEARDKVDDDKDHSDATTTTNLAEAPLARLPPLDAGRSSKLIEMLQVEQPGYQRLITSSEESEEMLNAYYEARKAELLNVMTDETFPTTNSQCITYVERLYESIENMEDYFEYRSPEQAAIKERQQAIDRVRKRNRRKGQSNNAIAEVPSLRFFIDKHTLNGAEQLARTVKYKLKNFELEGLCWEVLVSAIVF
jgi:hypothetical protein